MYTIAVHNGSSARRLHNIRDFCTVIKEPHIQIREIMKFGAMKNQEKHMTDYLVKLS